MRKKHGQHNLDLTQIILDTGDYNDWVVTTAFYSAVHFVEHALFPLIENGIEYPNYNDYWDINFRPKNKSKHTGKVILVRRHLHAISVEYRNLLDDCNGARYNDYQVNDYIANDAKRAAEKIKVACLGKKP